jgi:hypothetical protein
MVQPGRTQDNMAHAHCMLHTKGYKHTLCNTYYFSATTMVARTHRNYTLHVQCPSCYIFDTLDPSLYMLTLFQG